MTGRRTCYSSGRRASRTLPGAHCALSAFLSSKTLRASSAALTPLRAMAPKVGPVRGQLLCHKQIPARSRLTHAISTVDFRELHSSHDESWYDLPSALDNCILCRLHVKATHAAKLLKLLHAYKSLDREGAKGAIVSSGADDKRCIDGVGVHAGLVVVVHRHQGPVSDHTCDAHITRSANVTTSDEILDGGGVEELDVGELQHLGQNGRGEQGCVLHDDKVAFVLEGDANLGQEGILWSNQPSEGMQGAAERAGTTVVGDICTSQAIVTGGLLGIQEATYGRLAHDHCREELNHCFD